MKCNAEIKVNVTLGFEELDLLSTVLCGLTAYCRDDLKKILKVEDFNRFNLESLSVQFSHLFVNTQDALKCYER